MIGGILAIIAGIAVLIVRYRRRDRVIVFMPLVPLGVGLMVMGALLLLDVGLEWVASVAFGSVIIAFRRVPLVLLWTGRISNHQAALLYAAILPLGLLVLVTVASREFPSWPVFVAAGLLFLTNYGVGLAVFPNLAVRQRN